MKESWLKTAGDKILDYYGYISCAVYNITNDDATET